MAGDRKSKFRTLILIIWFKYVYAVAVGYHPTASGGRLQLTLEVKG